MSVEEEYLKLANNRTPYEDRAEECSALTIPSTFPDENLKGQDNLDREYMQGFGAMLVNHFVGKLALTILPPSQPFFRLSATAEAMAAVAGEGSADGKFEIERILAQREEDVLRGINKSNFRASLYPALRHSVITGNGMVERLDEGYKVHGLRSYVVKRDYKGTIVQMILMEKLDPETLPAEMKAKIPEEDKGDEDIPLYTNVTLRDGKYVLTQELLGEVVGNESSFKRFEDRFIDVSWNRIDGEDYGRSFVEDHLGTMFVLNKLLKVTAEGIAEGVKLVKLLNPNGMTSYEDYVDATHGDVIIGNATDVTTAQSDKVMDLNIAKDMINDMKQELSRAFLVTGASVRDSERTTAQEVNLVANEVEASLGGVYTRVSGNIQRPIVSQELSNIKVETGNDVDIIITTGLQALGRNVELNKINTLIQELQMLSQLVGPEVVAKEVNVGAISSAMVANSGVASKDFLYTQKEKDQMAVEQQKQEAAQMAMQGGLPQAGANMANQATQGEEA